MSGNTHQITPFMHVADLDAAVTFLVDTLGFEQLFRHDNYAYLEREGAGMRVLEHTEPRELGTPHRGFAYYIDVASVDVVLEQIGDKLAALPKEDVYGPVDQHYRQRELLVRAPDGNLVVFGASLATS